MKRLIAVGVLTVASLVVNAAQPAASFPTKPIRMIVPLPAGGGVDWMARQVAHKLSEFIGQSVVVDNRAGAGGNIGMELAAKSPPDGYTLVLGLTAHYAINQSLYSRLPYDPLKDFVPIILLAETPFVMLVHSKVPAKSVKELVDLAKAQRGKMMYASGGNGSGSHLSGEMLKTLAGVDIVHVPYKGLAPAIGALLGEQVQLYFGVWSADNSHVKSGRLRALGVTTAKRSRALSELPAIAETLPGYDISAWYGIAAPAKTPREIVSKLNAELSRVLAAPDFRQRIEAEGIEPIGSTPEQFRDYIKSEIVKWRKIVKLSGAAID